MDTLDSLREHGYWPASEYWKGIDSFTKYLLQQPAYVGHVLSTGDGIPRTLNSALAETRKDLNAGYACYSMESVLSAPGFLDFILPFTNTAAEYFQEEPHLYSVNAFWKKPSADADWHFDHDDRKVMVLFMYGTDIIEQAHGPHAYVRGSHKWDAEYKTMLHRSGVTPGRSLTETFLGRSGTYFLTDTNGLHVGYHPQKNPRLLIWARWCVSNPPKSYTDDKLSAVPASRLPTIPADDALKDRTNLVIDWSS